MELKSILRIYSFHEYEKYFHMKNMKYDQYITRDYWKK